MKKLLTISALLLGILLCCKAQETEETMNIENPKDALIEFKTTMGDIVVELFNDTPLHRDNFIKLVTEGYYDSLLFHRVIDGFMIQTGDPDSRTAKPGQRLGTGSPDYTIEAEIDYPKHFHKYGALAAARTGDQMNPERRSSGSQFYFVTGRKVSPAQLDAMQMQQQEEKTVMEFRKLVNENRDSMETLQKQGDEAALETLRLSLIQKAREKVDTTTLPENLKEEYISKGGTPHLDGAYTVFGQVVKGMETVEKIQKAETDSSDRPREDIRIISAKVLKSYE